MSEQITFPRKSGQPKISAATAIFNMIEDFRPNTEVHAELLSRQGLSARDREELRVNYLAFSDDALSEVRDKGGTEGINLRYFDNHGRAYIGKKMIEVYVGHAIDFEHTDAWRVSMAEINDTVRHEVGHYVDETKNGNSKPELTRVATIKGGQLGYAMTQVPKLLFSSDAFYALHPMYFDKPLQLGAGVAGCYAVGSALALGTEQLYKLAYRFSPREAYANSFSLANSDLVPVEGSPIDFRFAAELKKCAITSG